MDLKETVSREVNTLNSGVNYAPITIGSPNRTHRADLSVFERSAEEDIKVINAKLTHKRSLQQRYNGSWKKHLNVPERKLDKPIKHTF